MDDAPTPHQANNELPAGARRRILLIEDNLDVSETLCRVLSSHGHGVTVAYDGIAGLGLARQGRFDVLICDIGLPGLDGCELIARLRGTSGAHIPFAIAVSGYDGAEQLMRAISAGFGQYFLKPVDVDALLTMIASDFVTRFIAAAQSTR